MLSKPYASNFAIIKTWDKQCKLSMNPLELSLYNLIHQVSFAMPVATGKVHVEYHDPVRIRKAMDSSTAGCSYKLGCI